MKILLITFLFIFSFSFGQKVNELIIKKINLYRKQNGIPELVYESKAKLANDQMLNYMIETSTLPLDHSQRITSSFPTTFQTFIERITYLYQYNYTYIGENLCSFIDLKTDEEKANKVLELWKNSPKHNELMLNPKYDGLCVGSKTSNKIIIDGVTYDDDRIFYCVLTVYK
jgi:uncharacterized protein YkwD